MGELAMHVDVDNSHEYIHQLHARRDASGAPLSSENVTADLGELIDEAHTRAVLAEKLPADAQTIRVRVRPVYQHEPAVARVRIELRTDGNGAQDAYTQEFATGRWVRSAQRKLLELRDAGELAADQVAYRLLVTVARGQSPPPAPPPLQAPSFQDAELDACGVRDLGEGELEPDRPVLVNARLAAEALRRCEEAGASETGGAVLGRLVRLGRPLPETETRIVTVLSGLVEDPRHVGTQSLFSFHPEGLAEAARISQLRGLGESVLTVFHSHGWTPQCRGCRPRADCSLMQCSPSLQDYELLSLFPSKATLMPIAGRIDGVQGERPALRIHAWRGGQFEPIRWKEYHD